MKRDIAGFEYISPLKDLFIEKCLKPKNNKGQVILILGHPGSGKSVFMSQLYSELCKKIEYLTAIRAELIDKNDSPKKIYGLLEKISDEKAPKVFLLDSLDVLTSSRIKKLQEWLFWIDKMKELPRTTVVCACRSFEAEHLYPLSSQDWSEKHVLTLPPKEWVKKVLKFVKFDESQVSEDFSEFLQIPLHLRITVDVIQEGGHLAKISTLHDLYTKIFDALNVEDKEFQFMTFLAKKMVKNRSVYLALPSAGIAGIKKIKKAAKAGLVIIEQNRIYFSHQTLIDYLLAWEIIKKHKPFREFLLENNQNLFIRPVIRHVLGFLRNEPRRLVSELEKVFIDTANEKFNLNSKTSKIRTHIKRAILSNFASWPDPSNQEASFLIRIFNESKDGSLLMILFFDQSPHKEWFNKLKESFLLPSIRLRDDNEKSRVSFNYLIQVAKDYPEEVLNICLELISEPQKRKLEWFFLSISDIISSIELDESEKEKYVKFLEDTVKKGFFTDIYIIQTVCRRLSKIKPIKALELYLDSVLYDFLETKSEKIKYQDRCIASFFEIVPIIYSKNPYETLTKLTDFFNKILSGKKENSKLLDYPPFLLYGEFERAYGLKAAYNWYKEKAIEYSRDPAEIDKDIISVLKKSKWKSQKHLSMLCMLEHPELYQDEIIKYVRNILKLITKKEAEYSDSELFIRVLEKGFHVIKNRERQDIIEKIANLNYEDDKEIQLWIWKPLQHIPRNFLSDTIQNKINELKNRFGEYRYSPPIKLHSFQAVGSPIPGEELRKMEPEKLLTLLLKKRNLRTEWNYEEDKMEGGTEELAREAAEVLIENLNKYRNVIDKLALDLKNDIYLKWIFLRIKQENINKQVLKWLVPLILKLGQREYLQFEIVTFCSKIIEKISKSQFTKLKTILIKIASTSKDPEIDRFFKYREQGYANDAIGEGINSTRGALCEVLIKMIVRFYDEEIMNTLKKLAKDKTISVRAALVFYLPMGLELLKWKKCFSLFKIAFQKGPEEYADLITTFLQYVPKECFFEVEQILFDMKMKRNKAIDKSYLSLMTIYYYRNLIDEKRLIDNFSDDKLDLEAKREAFKIIANQTKFRNSVDTSLKITNKLFDINKDILSDGLLIIFLEPRVEDFKKFVPLIEKILNEKDIRRRYIYYMLEYLEKCLLVDAIKVFEILEKILMKSGKDFYDIRYSIPARHSKAPINIINIILECHFNLEERALEALDKLIELRWQGVDEYLIAIDRL